jgi:hypothetical protein
VKFWPFSFLNKCMVCYHDIFALHFVEISIFCFIHLIIIDNPWMIIVCCSWSITRGSIHQKMLPLVNNSLPLFRHITNYNTLSTSQIIYFIICSIWLIGKCACNEMNKFIIYFSEFQTIFLYCICNQYAE